METQTPDLPAIAAKPDTQGRFGCDDLLAAPSEKRIGFAHDRDLENGKEEWLTPPEIIKALGDFDLDPCSPINRPWATAKNHYTIEDNGLLKKWSGRVFCNPPYGPKTGEWMRRCAEHQNVTALIFARTETQQFFAYIWPKAKAVCFLKGRLSFYEFTCKVCGTGLSSPGHRKGYCKGVKSDKAVKGGTAGAPSMLVTWDDDNANALWDAVQHGRLKGAFVDLRGGNVAPSTFAPTPGSRL
jgi:hypothetical protein